MVGTVSSVPSISPPHATISEANETNGTTSVNNERRVMNFSGE
jgi:hypothetical protein